MTWKGRNTMPYRLKKKKSYTVHKKENYVYCGYNVIKCCIKYLLLYDMKSFKAHSYTCTLITEGGTFMMKKDTY